MSLIVNLPVAVLRRLGVLLQALVALARLIGIAFGALFAGGGTLKSRLAARLTAVSSQRLVFAVLRAVLPNLVLKRSLVGAYENTGTAVVTRYQDVLDVLERDDDFEVVYAPRMKEITDGENFFLGMRDTPRYTRDTTNMRQAMRRDDVDSIVAPLIAREAERIVAASKGRIDVPHDLTLPVPARMVAVYFGTPGPSEREMIDWTTVMFWYLFADLGSDPKVGREALDAAAKGRAYLDRAIAEAKATPDGKDHVLNRCLELQAAGIPGMSDLEIRNNLIGLIIGAIPTISKAATQALDQLLDRPEVLARAAAAARDGDDALLAACVFEAMRFNPVNPVIYRRAVREAVIARSTLRRRTIPQGTMVFAANLSAMFDPLEVPDAAAFRTDRPWHHYILWGHALHTCFGAHINRAAIPGVLKPLLKMQNLRRAEGAAGRIDTGGTPFPAHMTVDFDAG